MDGDISTKILSKFSAKKILNFFPILTWAPKYNLEAAICDLIAGITVGLTVIPQGIAYADVAGLDAQYGLYSSFMGCFVYLIFGSCKDITVGPTAIMALMTAEHAALGPDYAILLAFLSGIIILLFGIFQLGFLIDFISVPVISGFVSAAAITIASGQLKSIFGLKIEEESHIPGLGGTIDELISNFHTIRYQDTLLGISCLIILLLLREFKNVDVNKFLPPGRLNTVVSKTIWLVSTARNALIVVLALLIAYACDPHPKWDEPRSMTFILTGNISDEFIAFKVPPFTITNEDGTVHTFGDILGELNSAIIIIPLIAILENIAIAKAFAKGKPVDANQEMLALGLCNFAGSFVQSMPTTGSFSRTAVNSASGVKTQLGGLYTGGLVILAIAFLLPYCAFIPKASLGAVIVAAVIFSVEYEVVRPMWHASKMDLFAMTISFLVCLFWELEFGILIGAAFQILLFLFQSSKPKLDSVAVGKKGLPEIQIKLKETTISFQSINSLRNGINKIAMENGFGTYSVQVDSEILQSVDFTAAVGLHALTKDFESRSQNIEFLSVKSEIIDTIKTAAEVTECDAFKPEQ